MDQQTLNLFCRQLAHWAEGAIESGRSPFRRAETFFPLWTAAGEISPPLILWINRDSCMAGGILLFPARSAEDSLAEGRACSQALGLRHFVTWAPREIVIWEECGDMAVRSRVLPMPTDGADSPAPFCDIFRTLLEELKPLSIAGAVPSADLSPFYLANLCRLTLRAVTPFLGEAFRIASGESRRRGEIPSAAARQQAYLTLLRLLALLIEDRLPPTIEPEGLDRVLRFALDSLPQTFCRPLEINHWELPLPPAGAVRLQHLNRRLIQLRFAGNRTRCRQTLEILLQSAAGELGGRPLPPLPEGPTNAALLLHPDRCYPAADVVAEVASPPLLAFTALLRHLREEAPVPQAAHPLALGEMPPLALIRGFLPAGDPPSANERRVFTVRLRLSWPNRRFQLPPESPRWLYEFLHLLGLAGEGCRIMLDLPDDWLTAPYGAIIHAVLNEHFTLARLERRPQGVRIDLQKGKTAAETTFLVGSAGERRIPWAQLREEPRSFLPLALDLPEPLFALLRERKLQVPKEWPADKDNGIYLFSRSSFGRVLWQVVSGGRALPARTSLPSHRQRHAFPLPDEKILHRLQRLYTDPENEPARAVLDRELATWLGTDPATIAGHSAGNPKVARHTRAATEELLKQIRCTAFADGLPRFPEHYLYDHYRPQLIEYRFSGPLALGEEFFGQQRLIDREGKILTVEGSETARALRLASFSGDSPVLLPADRHLTAKILEQYLGSLRALRRGLIRESHRLLADARTADAVAGKIWESLSLPPWPLIVD